MDYKTWFDRTGPPRSTKASGDLSHYAHYTIHNPMRGWVGMDFFCLCSGHELTILYVKCAEEVIEDSLVMTQIEMLLRKEPRRGPKRQRTERKGSQRVFTCTERREEEDVEERGANWAYLRIARRAVTFVFGTKAQLRTFLWGGGTSSSSE